VRGGRREEERKWRGKEKGWVLCVGREKRKKEMERGRVSCGIGREEEDGRQVGKEKERKEEKERREREGNPDMGKEREKWRKEIQNHVSSSDWLREDNVIFS